MIPFCINDIFSQFRSVRYAKDKDYTTDYRNLPRPCHNFAFILEGECLIHTPTETIALKPKQILYIPQGTTYWAEWFARPNNLLHSLHFQFLPHCNPCRNLSIPIQRLDCPDFDEVYSLLTTIDAYQDDKTTNSFFAVSALFSLCGKLFQNALSTPIAAPDNPVFPAVEYLQSNHSADCTVEKLAELCFLSPSRFHFLFQKHTGYSPIVYKNKLLIQEASQTLLLEKNRSIESISEQYGFESAIYFRRLFKKITGKTPSAFRKENSLI